MARPLRPQIVGGLYHLVLRANHRQLLFRDEPDKRKYLELLERYRSHFDLTLYAYALLSRQIDLLIETPRANISKVMQCLGTSYSSYFNRRYRRRGTLFEGRFRSHLIDKENDLGEITRRIHRAPTRCGWKKLKYYPWTSYPIYLSKANDGVIVEKGSVLRLFGNKIQEQQKAYQKFVELGDSRASRYPASALVRPIVGASASRSSVLGGRRKFHMSEREEGLKQAHEILQDVTLRFRHSDQKKLWVERKRNIVRAVAMYLIRRHTSLPLHAVGALLGVKAPAVAVAVRNVEGLLSQKAFAAALKRFTALGVPSASP